MNYLLIYLKNIRKRELLGYTVFIVWSLLMIVVALEVIWLKSQVTTEVCHKYYLQKRQEEFNGNSIFNNISIIVNSSKLNDCFSFCRTEYK